LTVCGISHIAELRDGSVHEYTLEPEQLGLGRYESSSLAGGDPSENAVITREILAGRGSRAQRDVTALNAGAALFTAGAASSLETGVQQALEILASGQALKKLEAYAAFTQHS
jgi:anthranilate phosphoribosyltransferase